MRGKCWGGGGERMRGKCGRKRKESMEGGREQVWGRKTRKDEGQVCGEEQKE